MRKHGYTLQISLRITAVNPTVSARSARTVARTIELSRLIPPPLPPTRSFLIFALRYRGHTPTLTANWSFPSKRKALN